jgi:hypothetical protein
MNVSIWEEFKTRLYIMVGSMELDEGVREV